MLGFMIKWVGVITKWSCLFVLQIKTSAVTKEITFITKK